MAPERENTSLPGLGTLRLKSYSIAGNDIRAYYDVADKLVFVIDGTVDVDKPNALLVINPVGDRKWDDILANDYGVMLEMVRPKKDNKYQKLDIDYGGLAEYDNLIQDYDAGRDLDASVAALAQFRALAARRSATARLAAADALAQTARETIDKTNDTIAELTARLKTLRARLNQQKKSVGKEPTKQSAAKILRTESQIDATNEKLRRARRRLTNAQRRLATAEEDAAAARRILDMHTDIAVAPAHDVVASRAPQVPVFKDFDALDEPDDEYESDEDDSTVFETVADADAGLPAVSKNVLPEPKAKEMAEDDVKPLFNKNPEILDEEIAFKPIDFGAAPVSDVPSQVGQDTMRTYSQESAPAPLSFTPPSASRDDFTAVPVPQNASGPVVQSAPVLDTLTPVTEPQPVAAPQNYVEPAPQPRADLAYNDIEPARPASPMAAVAPAAGAAMRPASPVSGGPVKPVVNNNSVNSGNRGRPAFLYYLMLIALIVLSIFTLWLYQKSISDTVPDLSTTVEQTQDAPVSDNTDSPFLNVTEETVEVVEETPVVIEEQPVVLPEPEPEEEPVVPTIDETAPAIPVTFDDTPVVEEPVSDGPFLSEPQPVEPVVVNKPVYNAGSQNENMFVAAPEYETESTTVVDMYDNPVDYDTAPADVVPAEVVTVDDTVSQTTGAVCEDGSPTDANGCCAGEVFTDSAEGFVCCSEETGECFRPAF